MHNSPIQVNLLRSKMENRNEILKLKEEIKNLKSALKQKEPEQKGVNFRLAFDSAAVAMCHLTSEGIIQDVNQEMIHLLEYKKNEIIGKSFKDITYPEDLPTNLKLINQVKQGKKQKLKVEKRYISKSGKIIWAITSVSAVLNTSGEIKYFIAQIVDITKRKHAEQALTENEKKYRFLIESLNEGIWQVDKKGNTEFINPKMAQMLGYEVNELIGKSLFDFMNKKAASQARKYLEKRKNGIKEQHHISFKTKHGKKIICRVKTSPVYDTQNQYTGILAGITDITNEVKTQKELKNSRILFQKVFNSLHDAIFIINSKTLEIIDCNKAACDIFGYEYKKIINRTTDFLHVNDNSLKGFQKKLIKQIEEKDYFFLKKYKMKRKNGQVFYSEHTVVPIKNRKNKITAWVSVVKDITERQKNEQELVYAKEKAEENDKLKTAFLTNMSHEIRTPMNGIIGFSELLCRDNVSDNQRKTYSNVIAKSARQLLNTVNDILEVSKIEAGLTEIEEKETNLNSVLMDLFIIFKEKANDNNLNLFLYKDLDNIESVVITDEEKLYKILFKLLSNALKFTPEGHIKFGYKQKHNALNFFVEDTGIGINRAMHSKIFELFRQVDFKDNRKFEGIGLGLPICKAYIEMLGGKIWLESAPECGSIFHFTIPFVSGNQTNIKRADNEKAMDNENQDLVLVVEDEEVNYMYIEEILSEEKFKVIHAQNGDEAIEICNNYPEIKIILMDIKMHHMDGIEASIRIKEVYPEIPILVITAYSSSSMKKKARQSGCDEFITKPVSKSLLMRKINHYLVPRKQ